VSYVYSADHFQTGRAKTNAKVTTAAGDGAYQKKQADKVFSLNSLKRQR
jgi:hypothetical protein